MALVEKVFEKLADRDRTMPPPNRRPLAPPGKAGTSVGLNLSPGAEDDGWVVPNPVALSDGSRVQLYKDGEALHAAYEAIRRAKWRVCLEVYIFASDTTGRAIADLLAARAREGVSVYVIYDSFGSWDSDQSMFDNMRRAGCNLQEFHPIRPWETKFSWRPLNRDHRKLLVCDDNVAGMGGLNVGREYAGSWVVQDDSEAPSEAWRDNAIGIIGPAARFYLRSFGRTWRYVTHGGRIRKAALMHNVGDLSADLGLLASVPTIDSPLQPLVLKLVRDARRSVLMTMAYFAPDDKLIDALCKAAKKGVRVRLMLPGRSDVSLLQLAAQSFYERLMDFGVEVYERQGVVLHAKTMCIDEHITVIGSANLDYRSIEYNCELSSVVRSDEFGRQMCTLFDHDVRFAKRISLAEWRRRPRWDRVVQWAVSRARYLL